MSARGLLALVLVCAAAVAAALLVRAPETPKDAGGGPLIVFEPKDVSAIEFERGAARVRLERREGGAWALTAPEASEADPRAVQTLLRNLGEARRVREVDASGASGARYGLAPAEATVRLSMKGGGKRTLLIGRASPVSADRYAEVDGGAVMLADPSLGGIEEKGVDDFTERRLIPLEAERIRRIEIERPAGRLLLERDGVSWKIAAPFADLADDTAADALARTVASLEFARGERVAPPAPGAYPIRVRVEGDGGAIREARLAARGEGNLREGARWPSGAAGRVPEAGSRELERPAAEFRDRRLVSFSAPDARAIEVRTGSSTLEIHREKEGAPWTAAGGGGPLDGSRVEDFLDRVRWLRGKAEERPFPGAETTLIVRGASGELARVEIGPKEASAAPGEPDRFLARSTWRPGVVFIVDGASLGAVPHAAADLLPAPSPPPKSP